MGQITEEFARQMLVHCERKEHPPLTVWEVEQLARAWLEREALRELAMHLRFCRECGDTAVENCVEGKALWDACMTPNA